MQTFKADLHIHTLLSPCGSLDMSPVNIIEAALNAKLDIIGICDHNSTKQAPLIKEMGAKKGLLVLCGAEVNSIEEVHCLTLFETNSQLTEFQEYIDRYLMPVMNKPEIFGEQIVVDENEIIVEEIEPLLINALNISLVDIEQKVHQIGGLVIPAHVDRPYCGLFSQLGFIPENLKVDAFEFSGNIDEYKQIGKLPSGASVIKNSDAHTLVQIGEQYTTFEMESLSFSELKLALKNQNGRKILQIKST